MHNKNPQHNNRAVATRFSEAGGIVGTLLGTQDLPIYDDADQPPQEWILGGFSEQDWGSIFDTVGGIVLKVLKANNPCSSFFNRAPLVQFSAAGNAGPLSGLLPSTAADFFKSDNLEPNTGQKWPNGVEAMTNEGTGLNSTIGVNASASGAFFAPVGTVGPFQSNSLGGQAVSLLHELAHTLLLIPPDDSASVKAGFPSSQQNTQTILDHCLGAIRQALKGE